MNNPGRPAKIRSIFLSLIFAALALIYSTPKANAQSAELMHHYRQYQALEKASKYREAEVHAKRALELGKKEFGTEHKTYATLLKKLAFLYKLQSRYREAELLFKRSLAIYEKTLGPEHPNVASSLYNLAFLSKRQGRYREAELLYKRSLAIRKKTLGPDHPQVANSLYNLAALYDKQRRYGEAEPLYKRSLTIYEKTLGPEHPNVANSLNNLGFLYKSQSRYRKAEPLYKRSLAIREKALGPDHPQVANSLNNLAGLYDKQRRYGEAEPLYKRSLAIYEKTLGPEHPNVANSLNNLGFLYRSQSRYRKAEPLYKRSLAIREKALGPDHPQVANSLNNLAMLYNSQKLYVQAEPLLKRSLDIYEKTLGSDHPQVANSRNNLAVLYKRQGRYGEAEPLFKLSLDIYEKTLGPEHPNVANSLNNLALMYFNLGRHAQAESLYKHSLSIRKKALGPDHPQVANSLNNLAGLYKKQGRYIEAVALYKRSLAIYEKTLGPDHPQMATSLNNIAFLYFAQSDWARAANYWHGATQILTRRARREADTIGQNLVGKKNSAVSQNNWYFWLLVKSVSRQEEDEQAVLSTISGMFETAQWAMNSQAAGALAQMSARKATGSDELASIVRERQDSVRTWQQSEKRMSALRGAGKSDAGLEAQMTKLDKRITAIDKRLSKDFPDYAALASPKPLSIKQVQKLLGKDEALILLLDTPMAKPTPAETFIWAVTHDKAVWERAPLGSKALADKIALLRNELDPSTATSSTPPSYSGAAEQQQAKRGFAPTVESAGFSPTAAHELYQKLLGPVQEVIGGKKHLLVVGSGPLTALPFHLLIKQKPDNSLSGFEKYQKADWLIRHHAITTLPSVSSLKALRGIAKTAKRAPDALIGFADPVFSRSSRKTVKIASNRGYATFFRGRNVDLASLSGLAPLPGTRRELQGIGKILNIGDKHMHYGHAASESAVKKADLSRYRIVYFATHGLVSGDVKGLGEPALAFSAPLKSSDEDDGLLTASEVTELKLNADWLVMSACNTASGDKPGAEALSGLARAFFYAGAKTLLVSHWPVGDEAAVKLTTHAFKNMREHPELGRSEALRQSMLALLNEGGANAHPTVWAPFVVVGEGAGQ